MKTGSLYSVNDKALYDALHQSQLTKGDLKDLFMARGIIIPSEASREDLSKEGLNNYRYSSTLT